MQFLIEMVLFHRILSIFHAVIQVFSRDGRAHRVNDVRRVCHGHLWLNCLSCHLICCWKCVDRCCVRSASAILLIIFQCALNSSFDAFYNNCASIH